MVTSSKQPHIPVVHFPSGGVDLVLDILGFILEIGKKKINREEDVKYKELLVGSLRERAFYGIPSFSSGLAVTKTKTLVGQKPRVNKGQGALP